MKITIRMDDITPDMDWDRFGRFLTLLERYDVRALLGIVPENRDPSLHRMEARADFAEEMLRLQAEGHTLAMHGCYHVYTTKKGGLFPLNHLSEFAGRTEEEQRELIRTGKQLLEEQGIRTGLFMAPAHSYDRTTLKVLRECGFTALTDGFGTAPYRYEGLTFYPISFKQSKTLSGGEGMSTLVVHVNTFTDADFARYEEIFRTQELVPYSAWLSQPVTDQGALARSKEYWMANTKRLLVSLHR